MRRSIHGTAALVGATMVLAAPATGSAQPWLRPTAETVVSIEVSRPQYKEVDRTGAATGALFASARVPVSPRIRFVADLPFAIADLRYGGRADTHRAIGNPYLGVEAYGANGTHSFAVGVRPPITSEDQFLATVTGAFADIDRMEAFLPDILSLSALIRGHVHGRDAVSLHGHFGPVVWVPTDGDGSTEVLLSVSGQIWYEASAVRLGGGVTGRWMLTEDYDDISENLTHQITGAANFGRGRVRPGFHVRVPVDEYLRSLYSSYVGINLQMALR